MGFDWSVNRSRGAELARVGLEVVVVMRSAEDSSSNPLSVFTKRCSCSIFSGVKPAKMSASALRLRFIARCSHMFADDNGSSKCSMTFLGRNNYVI